MLFSPDWYSSDVAGIIPLPKQPLIFGESNNFFHDGHNVF